MIHIEQKPGDAIRDPSASFIQYLFVTSKHVNPSREKSSEPPPPLPILSKLQKKTVRLLFSPPPPLPSSKTDKEATNALTDQKKDDL